MSRGNALIAVDNHDLFRFPTEFTQPLGQTLPAVLPGRASWRGERHDTRPDQRHHTRRSRFLSRAVGLQSGHSNCVLVRSSPQRRGFRFGGRDSRQEAEGKRGPPPDPRQHGQDVKWTDTPQIGVQASAHAHGEAIVPCVRSRYNRGRAPFPPGIRVFPWGSLPFSASSL